MNEMNGVGKGREKERKNLLPPRTAIPPNIPACAQALLLPQRADVGRRDALVGAVVPLADVVGDFDRGAAGRVRAVGLAVRRPGQLVSVRDVEELEGALGALAGGYVAGGGVSLQVLFWVGSGTEMESVDLDLDGPVRSTDVNGDPVRSMPLRGETRQSCNSSDAQNRTIERGDSRVLNRNGYSHVSQLTGNNQAVVAHQRLSRRQHPLLAVGCQGDIRRACVAAVERPFGLAVADDEDAGRRHVVVDTPGCIEYE